MTPTASATPQPPPVITILMALTVVPLIRKTHYILEMLAIMIQRMNKPGCAPHYYSNHIIHTQIIHNSRTDGWKRKFIKIAKRIGCEQRILL